MHTQLKLVLEQQYGKTVISDCFFTSPLKVATPHTGSDFLEVMLMMASAGIMNGDTFSFDIICREGTRARLTEQSYSKIFDCSGGGASKRLSITVEKNAGFHYRPCPVIPFKNSSFQSQNYFFLDKTSVFVYSDILACGRVAMGEKFAFRHLTNKVMVYVDGCPVFVEHSLFDPQHQELNSMFYFDGYTHQGSFYCYTPDEAALAKLYSFSVENNSEDISSEILFGISRASAGVICRVLANRAQDIEKLFSLLQDIIF